MSLIPKNPASVTDKAKVSVSLINAIDNATDNCIAAPSSVRDLLSLYRVAVNAGSQFAAMANDGFTAGVLGPKIVEILGLQNDWTVYEPTYADLKNSHLPALAAWVKTNEAAILATAYLDSEGFVVYGDLPSNLQAEVAPLLANIAASYGA
jgi:hypothetical protein